MPRPRRRAWSARREYDGNPTAGSRSPGGRPAGRCSGPSPGGRAGAACWCRISWQRACGARPSSVAGATGKISAQRLRGMNRVSAANQARSAGSYRTRPAFRRSTAFSCRSTSNSASFSRSPLDTRTARLNNQRISRQTILSSTWSANHHRTSRTGETSRSTTRSSFRAAQDAGSPVAGLKSRALRARRTSDQAHQ